MYKYNLQSKANLYKRCYSVAQAFLIMIMGFGNVKSVRLTQEQENKKRVLGTMLDISNQSFYCLAHIRKLIIEKLLMDYIRQLTCKEAMERLNCNSEDFISANQQLLTLFKLTAELQLYGVVETLFPDGLDGNQSAAFIIDRVAQAVRDNDYSSISFTPGLDKLHHKLKTEKLTVEEVNEITTAIEDRAQEWLQSSARHLESVVNRRIEISNEIGEIETELIEKLQPVIGKEKTDAIITKLTDIAEKFVGFNRSDQPVFGMLSAGAASSSNEQTQEGYAQLTTPRVILAARRESGFRSLITFCRACFCCFRSH